MKALGLCIGASTISAVQLEVRNSGDPKVVRHLIRSHQGNPRQTLQSILNNFNLNGSDRVAITGRKFRESVNLSSISEPEAVEYAYEFVKPAGIQCPAVISAGGETFMVYVLNRFGRISNVITDNKCASGTGEFYLQQLRRLDVSLNEAAQWAAEEEPYPISGRCSVFCKSDCTHATNKGISKSKVVSGLCRMMANKILELLKKIEQRNIMIIGGTVRNRVMIAYLQKKISGLLVPEQATYFEALGTALWALKNDSIPYPGISSLLKTRKISFENLPPLSNFESMVDFKTMKRKKIREYDRCILGLDVGSTTTKAVLLRDSDNAILASVYLRTNGDPVGASRRCYAQILNLIQTRVNPEKLSIVGLGVCGSGRQIAGLHALTRGILNEIIAHATAAVFFDPQVDTIFEIGGQDAKYTTITNTVPSDYAMNEACSAGTGSFLEESAFETMGVKMEEIGDIAMKATQPPNFNDQCAAFIASDIKNAVHEGINQENIMAGLVYSICMNYNNRVKGNRPMGQKIFMQGGVCYNRAVPLAMATLVGKPIVVPPEPGLMGAFGVALEIKKRIKKGLLEPRKFNLEALSKRKVKYGKSFICKGGKENCDRHCEIAMIELEGKKYPFGGACNRYDNIRNRKTVDMKKMDLVRLRQQLVFEKYGAKNHKNTENRPRIGINKSFLVNTYYPLFSNFFSELGFELMIPDLPDQRGIDLKNAALCYPGELSYGFFYTLINSDNPPEFLFLPHFKSVPSQNNQSGSQVCPFVQGEPYYLQAAFQEKLEKIKNKKINILSPLLDLSDGLETARKPLVEMAKRMGIKQKFAEKSFDKSLGQQQKCLEEMKLIGKQAMQALEADPTRIAVVIFARPYNGFVEEAHMGIPHKFASRGIQVIPYDFLSFEAEKLKQNMYWGMGQQILKSARLVKKHLQLFGTYISNFSCGPDSFIIGYFRDIMGQKPSLTLELDSHTADAGLETRIEAFLDIISNYRQLMTQQPSSSSKSTFSPARLIMRNGVPSIITSSGQELPLTDPRVTLLFPSMGEIGTPLFAAVFRRMGIQAKAHLPAGEAELRIGRGNTSGKECLPLILTTGTLLRYIKEEKKKNEILVYFMATSSGPCRFGQYSVFMEDLIKRQQLRDVALLSLTSENSYLGLSRDIQQRGWWAIVISDVMEDVRSMILANACDIKSAMLIFQDAWKGLLSELENGDFNSLIKKMEWSSKQIAGIDMKLPFKKVPTILLTGEIFVRRDPLSRQFLTECLAKKGFATVCSPISEWMYYCNYLVRNDLEIPILSRKEKLFVRLRQWYMSWSEKKLKSIFSRSNIIHPEPIDIRSIIKNATPFLSPNLTGEAILTIGSSITEVGVNVCGVIAIGPFGCMPNRLSEAIIHKAMNRKAKLSTDPKNHNLQTILSDIEDLPFLAIESDGSPFPQLIQAKLETFYLQALRLHQKMISSM
jgi:predicted CoA-substrate-specific enzyme activase